MRASGWLVVCLVIGCGGGQTASSGGGDSAPPAEATLSVHVVGNGVVQTAAWSCGGNCQQVVTAPLSLQAVPSGGSTFGGWQGACSGTGACNVTLDGAPSVTAVFIAPSFVVTVGFSDSGAGRVTSTPSGIDCPGACSASFVQGTAVVLKAQAAATDVFHGWSDACAGTGDCSLTVSTDLNALASFQPVAAPPTVDLCTGLLTPLPQAFEASIAGAACAPGMADAGGTIGLTALGSGTRQVSFYDSRSGALLAAQLSVEQQGVTADYLPQPSGFLEVLHQPGADGNSVSATLFDHQGALQTPGVTLQGRLVASAAPLGGVILAGDLDSFDAATGAPQTLHEVCMVSNIDSLSWCSRRESAGPVYGAGVDQANRSLIITGGAAAGTITGQWFDGQGNALTSEFLLLSNFTAGANTWFEGRPLIGGGLAVRRLDQQNDATGEPYRTAQWLLLADAGASSTHAPPAWLAANTNLAIVRGGSAYALLPMGSPSAACKRTISLVASDGTLCQGIDLDTATPGDCRNEDLAMGLDGTLLELLPRADGNTCSWRYWPQALE